MSLIYNKTNWKDDKTTPVNARNLNNIEDGVEYIYHKWDKIIQDSTTGDHAAELIDARYGPYDEEQHPTLGHRLNHMDSELDQIIKRGFVTYSQFGAILDGRDCTAEIKNAHDFANQYGLIVRQNYGSFKISDTVDVKTNVDLSGSTIIIDDTTPNKIQYYIRPNDEYKNIIINQSELYEGATRIHSLYNYKNSFIKITSDEVFATRIDGIDYYTQESLVHISDGFILGGALMNDFTSGNITIQCKSILDNKINFTPPTVSFKKTNMVYINTLITCTRSNVTIKDVIIDSCELPDFDSDKYKGALISIHDCYNTKIESITGENLSAKAANSTQPTYILGIDHVVNIKLSNVNIIRGWGCMGTHYIKDVIFEDSYLNRIDNHIGCGDINIRNCTTYGPYGIYIGWGKGTINIENCKTIYDDSKAGGNSSKTCISLRTDWGTPFEGILNIKNHSIINNTENLEELGLITLWNTYDFSYNQSRNLKLCTINIDNITINNIKNTKVIGLKIGLNSSMNVTPNNVTINNVTTLNELENNYFMAFKYSSQNDFLRDIHISLNNIQTSIYSKYKTGFVAEDFNNMPVLKESKNLLYIYSPNSTNIYNIDINNCEGNIFISANNSININNSILSCLYLAGAKCLEFNSKNSELFPVSSDSGWSTILPCKNAKLTQNIIHAIKRDNNYIETKLENLQDAKLLINNFLIGKQQNDIASNLKYTVNDDFVK